MINTKAVIKELSVLLGMNEDEAEKYSTVAENTAKSIEQLLKDNNCTEDKRIIYLCAVKAFYCIVLSEKDDICSFSAGDISYSKNASAVENAEKLLKQAFLDCRDLLKSTGFAFKVV